MNVYYFMSTKYIYAPPEERTYDYTTALEYMSEPLKKKILDVARQLGVAESDLKRVWVSRIKGKKGAFVTVKFITNIVLVQPKVGALVDIFAEEGVLVGFIHIKVDTPTVDI